MRQTPRAKLESRSEQAMESKLQPKKKKQKRQRETKSNEKGARGPKHDGGEGDVGG